MNFGKRRGRALGGTGRVAVQVAALPYRWSERQTLEVLLVAVAPTGRWALPMGWPSRATTAAAVAGLALHRAGVTGTPAEAPIGCFYHEKRLVSGLALSCRVDVYPLAVTGTPDGRPGKLAWRAAWFSADEASRLVCNMDLQKIIARAHRHVTA